MVYGNYNSGNGQSGTGVLFTRNPATGENKLYGEFLMDAQGEDVVAGIRTPVPIAEMKGIMPAIYKELHDTVKVWGHVAGRDLQGRAYQAPCFVHAIALQGMPAQPVEDSTKWPPRVLSPTPHPQGLEVHMKDMQDTEFTVQDGRLFMLQTRNGKRTGVAALRVAIEMEKEGLVTADEAVLMVEPRHLDQLLHPMFVNEKAYQKVGGAAAANGPRGHRNIMGSWRRSQRRTPHCVLCLLFNLPQDVFAKGLAASPGAAVGKIVFTAEAAEAAAKNGEHVILCRTVSGF